ncbi:energy-coupling factor ABC transporter ATP-binding protein [Desertibacillus haloalkaliphilus]|uniref:energy-coupling factor ABC transporter ATP-binding protein n=1 Tax=Desertibacillus haloalkaliphilus TaxID=1328930 RepID=UPI001C2763DB|nr:energy-coupling factor ABC transporter ATP-binding protein [Desertibacillus haloalkaliphilus]MBU8908586.1 energy-coupling factor ABC transporter ATP-binding protein [Desertibacillus haloalkaliphilus]
MDITFKNVEHRYMINTPFERLALDDINLSIKSGSFIAIIGHTGSGKSTLMQHMNGLLKPTNGEVSIGDFCIEANKKNKDLKALRRQVGMVFQYPEHQLFAETVEKDISFGPVNFGVSESVATRRAKGLLPQVGLSTDILEKSPFDLSGGQMRRVAIAGVLATEPSVLILDEPTAGLDPQGHKDMMEMFYNLHHEKKMTTILVTHNMLDAALYADYIYMMKQGSVYMEGTPEEIFQETDQLHEVGLDLPETIAILLQLEKRFKISIPRHGFTVKDAAVAIKHLLDSKKRN